MNLLLQIAICISYFAIGWTSTTDILRLTKGCSTPVHEFRCYCDACGAVVPMRDQIPYYSYFRYGGTCKSCGAKIPVSNVLLELIVFLPMCVISALFHFLPQGVLWSFVYYEALKLGYLLVKGRRESHFFRELAASLALNFLLFLLVSFMALLGTV